MHARPGVPLSAEQVAVVGLRSDPEILGNGDAPGTLIAASPARSGAVLDQIRLSGRTAVACRLLRLRTGLVVGFDQSGSRMLYLLGSGPPALWRATIKAGSLVDARRLLRNANLGAVAW